MTIEVTSNDKPQTSTPPPVKAAGESGAEGTSKESLSALAENAEQNAASESETEEHEETEGTETETEELESGQEAEAKEAETANKPNKKGGFQRRIDKLNLAKAKAQQEADFWKQQALKGAGEPKKEIPVESKSVSAEGKPDPAKFETHNEYVEALTDWKTEQKFKEHDQKLEKDRQLSEQAKAINTHRERVKAFAEKTDDFEETLANLDDVRSATIESIVISSENGPELLYELAKNPEEAKRIALLSPLAAAREMGKIEARIAPKSSSEKISQQKTTKAPQPLTPVKGGGTASIPKTLGEAADTSFAAYKKLREAEIKKRRQA